jgi:hypothetical protein
MKKATKREQTEANIIQQIQNEVQETLLHHAPAHWRDQQLDRIEAEILGDSRSALASLSAQELVSPDTLKRYVELAVAETKRRILEQVNTIVNVYDQLARPSLLPESMSETILAGLPPAGDAVMALVVGSIDYAATVEGDPTSTMNERRIARACLSIAFLTALASPRAIEQLRGVS